MVVTNDSFGTKWNGQASQLFKIFAQQIRANFVRNWPLICTARLNEPILGHHENAIGAQGMTNQYPEHKTDRTSLTLLQRMRDRDEDAWRAFFDLYTPLLHQWCRRARLNPTESEEVVQSVCAAVTKGLDGFDRNSEQGSFRGWLRVICRNKIRDFFRACAKTVDAAGGTAAQQQLEQQPDPLAEDEDSGEEMSQLYSRALELVRSQFEDRTWDAFWMSTIENQSTDLICKRLDMSAGAVRTARYRVLKTVRSSFEELLT